MPSDGLRSGEGLQPHERHLDDSKVREGIKEIAQLDGAFVVSSDGHVVAGAQQTRRPRSTDLSLPKGFGARHWAAAEISRATTAVAITVSESTGTVRLFQNGEVMLRIEPFRRAMKWIDFDTDPTPPGSTRIRISKRGGHHVARRVSAGTIRRPSRNGSAIWRASKFGHVIADFAEHLFAGLARPLSQCGGRSPSRRSGHRPLAPAASRAPAC